MTTLTVKRFEEMIRPLRLGRESGLVILPLAQSVDALHKGLYHLKDDSPIRGDRALKRETLSRDTGLYARLACSFAEERWKKRGPTAQQPAWVRGVSHALAQEIGRQRFLDTTGMERPAHFPLGGFDYVVLPKRNSLVHQVERAFKSDRLWNIAQWGYLEPIAIHDEFRETTLRYRSPHVRQMHMRDAYTLMQLITRKNRLPGWIRIVLAVAALTHDVFTIAGGDSMKWCDPKHLHEERLYAELLHTTGWDEIVKRFRLPKRRATKLLIDTVQGRGPYRELLKLVDWTAYLGRDIAVYARMVRGTPAARDKQAAFADFIRSHPKICALWETIGVDNERIFLRDAKVYADFARARMHMYHQVYLHPELRYREFLIAAVIGRALYEDGVLTKERLLNSTDHDLDQIFCEFLEINHIGQLHEKIGRPTLETFASREDALRREAELIAEGVPIVMLEDLSDYCIKPGVDYLVQTADGLKTFEEVDPETAVWLKLHSKLTEPIRIYYVRNARLTPTLDEALRRFYQRRKATTSTP